jgi:DNA-binding NarL/FixJ family response regulator
VTKAIPNPIRVLLVEDHAVVREGISLVLQRQSDLRVVGEAGTAADALRIAIDSRPDVILIDISLGDEDGVPVIEMLHARIPEARLLVLSMFDDAETVRQALLAGAVGYIVKGASAAEVSAAIRAVARGDRFLYHTVAGPVIDDGLRWLRSGSTLTPREREVLSLLASGNTARGIGRALGISAHTVRRHLSNTASKLNVHGAASLARYAARHGLVRPARTSPVRVASYLSAPDPKP